jgi:sec-independent protein translocase protein TatA
MGIGVPELLLLFLIVLVVFGTKRLRNIGGDLGGAIKSFRHAMNDGEGEKDKKAADETEVSAEKQDKV